jgi:hypothetical protein
VRKRGEIPRIPSLFNNFIVIGFLKKRPNIQQLINTIWKLCQMKRQGLEIRKHSDVSGKTQEINENFLHYLQSVMRDIQPGPSEYKLGA